MSHQCQKKHVYDLKKIFLQLLKNGTNRIFTLVTLETLTDLKSRRKGQRIYRKPYPISPCVIHDRFSIKLFRKDNYYLSGGWLSDEDIYNYLRLLKADFSNINGLECSYYLPWRNEFLENPANEFIRILYYDNRHWITVTSGLKVENDNAYIYYSLI